MGSPCSKQGTRNLCSKQDVTGSPCSKQETSLVTIEKKLDEVHRLWGEIRALQRSQEAENGKKETGGRRRTLAWSHMGPHYAQVVEVASPMARKHGALYPWTLSGQRS